MSAGTDSTSVTNEMMRPRLSARASLRPPSSTPHPSPPPGNRASRSTSRAVSLSPAALGPQPTQSSCGTVPRWERGTYAHAITSPSCARNTALSRGGEVPGTGQLGGAWRARTLAEVTRTFPRSAAGIVGLARCRLTTILPLVAVHTFTPVQLGPRPRGLDKPERLILKLWTVGTHCSCTPVITRTLQAPSSRALRHPVVVATQADCCYRWGAWHAR